MGCFPDPLHKEPFLDIRCLACGHKVRWEIDKAVRLLGYSTGPVFAAAKLKCSACGEKRIAFD